jgi:predicted RNA-binding Zn-ribbon protein involved in translation (DUF1610 family)
LKKTSEFRCPDCGLFANVRLEWKRATDGRWYLLLECDGCGAGGHVVRRINVKDLCYPFVVDALAAMPRGLKPAELL